MKKFLTSFTKFNLFVIFFAFVAVILLATVSAIPGNGSTDQINKIKDDTNSPFQSSLTRGRFALVKSYVDEGTLIIDKYATTTFPDIIYDDGHYYSVFIPGTAFLAMPLYWLGKQYDLGILATNLAGPLAIFLTALVMYMVLRRLKFQFGITLLSIFIMIFGTQLFTYSTTLNAHYFSALAVALALWGTVLSLQKKWAIGLPMFWFAFGLGMVVDYPNALTIFPLGILLFLNSFGVVHKLGKQYLTVNSFFYLSIAAALIFILPYFNYVYTIFGTYFTTIEPHQINGFMDHGKLNFTLAKNPAFYLDKDIVFKTLELSQHYLPMGFFSSLFSAPRGLFVYSSFFILAFFGIKTFMKEQKGLFIACAAAFGITVLTYSSYADYAGGWAYGPRFMIGVTPILALMLAYALKRYILNFGFLIAFVVTSITSISIATLGALTSKLLVSPIENNHWGFSNSFLVNIPQIHTEKYVSYLFDQYLRPIMTPDLFLCIIYGSLVIVFVILTNITVLLANKEVPNYD